MSEIDDRFGQFENVKTRLPGGIEQSASVPVGSELYTQLLEARKTSGHVYELKPGGKEESLGSGYVATPDGKFVTDRHVVVDDQGKLVDKVAVYVNGHRYEGEPISADPKTDLATVQLATGGAKLDSVTLGNFDDLKPGQSVFGFGFDKGSNELTVMPGKVEGTGPYQSFTEYGQLSIDREENPWRPVASLNIGYEHGDSGGQVRAIGSDGKWHVMATNESRDPRYPDRSGYATSSADVARMLRDLPVGSQTERTFLFGSKQLYPKSSGDLNSHDHFQRPANTRIGSEPLYDPTKLYKNSR
jgi:S1-C subfamily serine protease